MAEAADVLVEFPDLFHYLVGSSRHHNPGFDGAFDRRPFAEVAERVDFAAHDVEGRADRHVAGREGVLRQNLVGRDVPKQFLGPGTRLSLAGRSVNERGISEAVVWHRVAKAGLVPAPPISVENRARAVEAGKK